MHMTKVTPARSVPQWSGALKLGTPRQLWPPHFVLQSERVANDELIK